MGTVGHNFMQLTLNNQQLQWGTQMTPATATLTHWQRLLSYQAAAAEQPVDCMQEPLVGAVGQDFVQHTLNTQQPQRGIQMIQAAAALRDPRTKPLLSLLDHMGVSR